MPQVTNDPTLSTCADGGGGNAIWYSSNNAVVADGQFASALVGSPGPTNPLVLTARGLNLPAGATVTGLGVAVVRSSQAGLCSDLSVRISLNDGSVSRELAAPAAWPTSASEVVYGGPSDLCGFTPASLTPGNINGDGFGVALSVQAAGSDTAFVDRLAVSVYFADGTAPAHVDSPFILTHML